MPPELWCRWRKKFSSLENDKGMWPAYTYREQLNLSVATTEKWQARRLSDRAAGASAKAAVHLPYQNNPTGLFILAGIRLP